MTAAIGAGIAVLTGLGAGLGMVWQPLKQWKPLQGSRKQTEKSVSCCCWAVPWQRLPPFMVSLSLCYCYSYKNMQIERQVQRRC